MKKKTIKKTAKKNPHVGTSLDTWIKKDKLGKAVKKVEQKRHGFPDQLFVVREDDKDGTHYFVAHETPAGAGELNETVRVARYERVEVGDVIAPTSFVTRLS